MLKISVITPSYNQGIYVKKCLDSVRSQIGNFKVEHIILDNCSSDNTYYELMNYKNYPGDVDVKIFIDADDGQTSAINKGFKMATGEVVCWLNTDEFYNNGALSKVCEYLKAHPEVDVLFGNCDFVDAGGLLVKKKREFFFSKSMLMFYGCFVPSCSTFVRRKVLDSGLFLNPEFKVTMDFDWYVRIANSGYRFSHFPETLASFTWHESNISSTLFERRLIERRLVQDRYSGVRGPAWFRTFVYEIMRIFWLSVRVMRRKVA